ncbi:hypothetical protein HN51_006725 [Arachis hypogaea]|uniref:Acetyltransferase n=1 Tax=Arachis hypogaea TaxID=3818 RepID=A0A444WTC9_ARAHY|nr:uncharacterized acetyltransferase At3g50280 [Arachis hypogaea]QHO40713.1 putative acetyltransferase [Arachis hypogaea]RYQ80663.1 hypothetical protein Ahy_Scaffold1g106924 [Arachis hypogaea]
MASVKVISTSTIHAANKASTVEEEIQLTPWDLQLLLVDPIQKGLLYRNDPVTPPIIIQHLKHSLSSTLSFFPPLAGRLSVTEHDDNTSSVSVICNNSGALFVHAVAGDYSVNDIVSSVYTPHFVHSLFPLNRVRNHEGTTKPLLAVQVTELNDGYFIGCTMNHVVGDGTSFWHFMNSWAEISRGSEKLSKPPVLERWFLDSGHGCSASAIRVPLTKEKMIQSGYYGFVSELQRERVFHFSKDKIAELKTKAKAEIEGESKNKISSLQALLTHLWRSVVRNQGLEPDEEVNYRLLIGGRGRMKSPALAENYFGNAVQDGTVSMKVKELLEGGLGKGALEMRKIVDLHTEEKMKSYYRGWVKNPRLLTEGGMAGNALVTSSSPRFDVYGNDFGWGKPVAVRSGAGNKSHGKITVFAGAEDGVDIEVCLSYEILEAMGNDRGFMDAVSLRRLISN